jgi:hypothetical protein
MSESIYFAIQVYFFTFVISLMMAGLIKLMLWVIRRFSPKTPQPASEASGE